MKKTCQEVEEGIGELVMKGFFMFAVFAAQYLLDLTPRRE